MDLFNPKSILVNTEKNMVYWHLYDNHDTTQLHILSQSILGFRLQLGKKAYIGGHTQDILHYSQSDAPPTYFQTIQTSMFYIFYI